MPLVAQSCSYSPPTPLEDLHILDFLELAGSQSKAGIALGAAMATTPACITSAWPTASTG